MNKKAFIFSITVLYYVAIFISFVGLIILSVNTPLYSSSQDSLNIRTMDRLTNNDSSDATPPSDNWCVLHIAYDANESLTSQSNFNYKKYCEEYNEQRII